MATDLVEIWVVRYMGYEVDVASTKHEAEVIIAETWQSIRDGRNTHWDLDDFDGFDANDNGTGFLNAMTIDSDWVM